ncbi:hypothetical protein EDC04DRAFT_2901439 [Pisolithus marmoratus]|nr:hypothetical protein EDC04DRAFT_2901439 [Pisolithus marmoratus]
MSFSGRNPSSYLEKGHQSRLTESYDVDPSVLAVPPQLLWAPTRPESSLREFVTPTASKNTENANLKSSHSTDSVEGHGDGTNGVETSKSGRYQQGCALADDERFIRWSEDMLGGWEGGRPSFVLGVIQKLLEEACDSSPCPKVGTLWLQIIEGNADDDVWLWVDGDEAWLRENRMLYWDSRLPSQSEWADAQSALRRRIALQRYPTVTGSYGKRNERVRNATPAQRVCAIAWLISSSKGVAELFAFHGRTPPTFRTLEIAITLSRIVVHYWDAFPSQTSAWENALATSKEDGCTCIRVDCWGLKQCFSMVVWLEGTLPTLEVGYKSCVRCRSLLKSRYEDIAAECTLTSHVSLLDAITSIYGRSSSRHGSPTAESLVTRKLGPLMKKHGPNVRYLPSVNKYPHGLREHVLKQFCGWKDNVRTVEFPDNILDGAHDPWVVLGIILLVVWSDYAHEDTDMHNEHWHNRFLTRLRDSLSFFNMPVLPRLSSMSVRLCYKLNQDCAEQRLFSHVGADDVDDPDWDWVCSDQDGRQFCLSIAVFVAVSTFLQSKGADLYGCRRCQVICTESFVDTSSSVPFEVANPGEHEGLAPSWLPTRGEEGAMEGDRSSLFQGSLEAMQEPVGMKVFVSMLRNSTLSQDEKRLRLATELLELRQYADSLGVDMSDPFELRLKESSLRKRLPEHGTSSSSKLSKSDKVEKIKDRLLEMLKELGLPYERLPWYTLEKDLEKNGYALINWPAGVLRKRGNRGIHDLSAVEVNKLYEAITCSDETRLRICRSQSASALTVVVQPVTLAVASGSKRPIPEERDLHSSPLKRIRFKDMTTKVSQQNLREHQGDGVVGSDAL